MAADLCAGALEMNPHPSSQFPELKVATEASDEWRSTEGSMLDHCNELHLAEELKSLIEQLLM